jgi:hypothetical protein
VVGAEVALGARPPVFAGFSGRLIGLRDPQVKLLYDADASTQNTFFDRPPAPEYLRFDVSSSARISPALPERAGHRSRRPRILTALALGSVMDRSRSTRSLSI